MDCGLQLKAASQNCWGGKHLHARHGSLISSTKNLQQKVRASAHFRSVSGLGSSVRAEAGQLGFRARLLLFAPGKQIHISKVSVGSVRLTGPEKKKSTLPHIIRPCSILCRPSTSGCCLEPKPEAVRSDCPPGDYPLQREPRQKLPKRQFSLWARRRL